MNRYRQRRRRPSFRRDEGGSLTVEALLILPVLLLLIVLFARWGLILRDDLRRTAEAGSVARRQVSLAADVGATDTEVIDAEGATAGGTDAGVTGIGFLLGGPPARRIRDADLLIYWGYAIKEKLPGWIKSIVK